MNCRDFEAALVDLARPGGLQAEDHQDALTHAESCANCAGRLAGEHALTAGLKAAAMQDAAISVPVRLELALRAAFLAQQNSSRRRFFSRPGSWSRPLLAAAAAGAIAAGIVIVAPRPATRSPQAPMSPMQVPAPHPSAVALPPPQVIAPGHRRNRPDQKIAVSRPLRRKPPIAVEQSQSVEVATDFLPLTNQSSATNEDRAGLVRIRLPRAALRSFGLLLNEDRAAEQIDADVLLGADGQARAVRFVENISTQPKRGTNENRN